MNESNFTQFSNSDQHSPYKRVITELDKSTSIISSSYMISLPQLPKLKTKNKSSSILQKSILTPTEVIQTDLNKRKGFMKQIYNKISENYTYNMIQSINFHNKQTHLVNIVHRLTKSKPMKKPKNKIPQNYSLPEPEDDTDNTLETQSIRPLLVHWEQVDETLWRPPVREGSSMAILNDVIYMYGGLGQQMYDDLMILDSKIYKWSQAPIIKSGFQEYPLSRYGHTLTASQKSLFLYGGETITNSSNTRQYSANIFKYDIEKFKWETVKYSGINIQPRKHHAAEFVGKSFIIIGGVNEKRKILNELVHFNTQIYRFQNIVLDQENHFFSEGIAYHAMCAVYLNDKFSANLYQKIDQEPQEEIQIKNEGLYIYGGMNQQNQLYNDIYLLDFQTYPAKLLKLKTKGQQPPPLCLHSMVYNDTNQFLIIYGGKTEAEKTIFNKNIFILGLRNLHWLKLMELDHIPPPRAGHSAVTFDQKVLIFGGFNINGFVSSKLEVFELGKQDQEIDLKKENDCLQLNKNRKAIKHLPSITQKQERKNQIEELNKHSLLMKEQLRLEKQLNFGKQSKFSSSKQLSQILKRMNSNTIQVEQ